MCRSRQAGLLIESEELGRGLRRQSSYTTMKVAPALRLVEAEMGMITTPVWERSREANSVPTWSGGARQCISSVGIKTTNMKAVITQT